MKMHGDWANVSLNVTDAAAGVLLISLDYNVGEGANVRFLANNGNNFFTAFDGEGIKPGARSGIENAFSFKKEIVKPNLWNNIKVYIDNDNRVFTLIANGKLIKKNVPFYGNQTGLRSLQVQHENGNDTYIDNLSVTKIEAMPVFNYSNFLFRTDFDCYTQKGDTTADAFTEMPYADLGYAYANQGKASPVNKDEAHGRSMKLSGRWANLTKSVTGADTGIQLVSLDYYMDLDQDATVRFLANNGSNFCVAFTGTGIKPASDDDNVSGYKYTEGVVKTGSWNTVKVYVDNTNKKFTLIANDSLIAQDVSFYDKKTGLSSLQIQHKDGADIYIDNLSVRTLSVMPTFDSEPLFSTDFDSYTVNGVTVADEFTGGIPYAILGYASGNTGKASPVNKDEVHGTSMKLSGKWAMIQASLNARFADISSGIKVISFDYYMESDDGVMKFFGNNSANFQVYCTGNKIRCNDTDKYKTGVIDKDKWNSVKIYVDNTNKLFAVYANDTVIVQNKTFKDVLKSIQMQHEKGSDVYIDNLKIENFTDNEGYYHNEAFTFRTSNSINENSTVTVVIKTGDESATNTLKLSDLTGAEITTVTGGGEVEFAVFINNVPEGTSIESIRLN